MVLNIRLGVVHLIGTYRSSELGAEVTTLKQLIDFPDVILRVLPRATWPPLLALTVPPGHHPLSPNH